MNEPIWIVCEGVGCPTHNAIPAYIDESAMATGMCMMCGQYVDTHADGVAQLHDRKDILAMIMRGDFDAFPSTQGATTETHTARHGLGAGSQENQVKCSCGQMGWVSAV